MQNEESASGNSQIRLTLRKSDKLKTKKDFDEIKDNGRRYFCHLFTLLLVEGKDNGGTKCGVICSRKFHKRAVVRNRARRLVWESFRLLKPELHPCSMLIIPKRSIFTAKRMDVSDQMAYLLKKAGLLTISQNSD